VTQKATESGRRECSGEPRRRGELTLTLTEAGIAQIADAFAACRYDETSRHRSRSPQTRAEADEGARLEIALAVCDGVLQISITLQSQPVSGDHVTSVDRRKPQ